MLSVQETGFVVLYLYLDLFPLKLGVLRDKNFSTRFIFLVLSNLDVHHSVLLVLSSVYHKSYDTISLKIFL